MYTIERFCYLCKGRRQFILLSAYRLKRQIVRSISCSIKIYFELSLKKKKALSSSSVCLTNKSLFWGVLISCGFALSLLFDQILFIWAVIMLASGRLILITTVICISVIDQYIKFVLHV